MAAEAAAGYDTGARGAPAAATPDPAAPTPGAAPVACERSAETASVAVAARVSALVEAVDGVQQLQTGGLAERVVHQLLADVNVAVRRLQATTARLAGDLQRRHQPAVATGSERDQAQRRTARTLTDELNLAPGEAKRATTTGRHLLDSPLLGAAFDAGTLSAEHAAAIAGALTGIPPDHRPDTEQALVALAATATPQQVATEGRRLAARLDDTRAQQTERARHVRRRANWWQTTDGDLRIDATLSGVDAETVRVALDAATPPPGQHEHRTPDQRRADGLTNLAATSLRAGELPAQHGVRPHVQVIVTLADLRTWTGDATLGSGETITMHQLAGIAQDCIISRTILGLDDAPIAGSIASRTIPAALWRALLVRDRGCTWPHCDAPASWCQVAHGAVPFAAHGALSPDNAALLCGHHHRRFDAGGWNITIDGNTVTYQPDPNRPSAAELARQHTRSNSGHTERSTTRTLRRAPDRDRTLHPLPDRDRTPRDGPDRRTPREGPDPTPRDRPDRRGPDPIPRDRPDGTAAGRDGPGPPRTDSRAVIGPQATAAIGPQTSAATGPATGLATAATGSRTGPAP